MLLSYSLCFCSSSIFFRYFSIIPFFLWSTKACFSSPVKEIAFVEDDAVSYRFFMPVSIDIESRSYTDFLLELWPTVSFSSSPLFDNNTPRPSRFMSINSFELGYFLIGSSSPLSCPPVRLTPRRSDCSFSVSKYANSISFEF
jgi:hypothetical protein